MKITDWSWRHVGGQWHLFYDEPGLPVALSASVHADGSTAEMVVRDPGGVLVPLTAEHPVARLIALAPEMAQFIQETARICTIPSVHSQAETLDRLVVTLAAIKEELDRP